MSAPRFTREQTALLVVDVQAKLLPHMYESQAVLSQCCRLADGAKVLEIPVLVTEQYRKGLGETVPELLGRLGDCACREEKLKFSACIEPVREVLVSRGIRNVVVCGIEAHVCVLQTCLDLAQMGYVVAVAADAVSSRRAMDRDISLQRLIQASVIPTTVESILLEMVHEAGGELFKRMLPVVK